MGEPTAVGWKEAPGIDIPLLPTFPIGVVPKVDDGREIVPRL